MTSPLFYNLLEPRTELGETCIYWRVIKDVMKDAQGGVRKGPDRRSTREVGVHLPPACGCVHQPGSSPESSAEGVFLVEGSFCRQG